MYPTSAAYKTAIQQNVRDVCISGTITLKDATVINISDGDIVQGSLYFTEQCVSGENIEIGNVYASELGLSLSSSPENPYNLDGARVVLNFGIDVGNGVYEYVPLGYFYVTEIERKNTVVALKALDGMILFDVDIVGVQTSGTPFEIVEACCAKAGITLATSLSTFNTFANAGTTFVLPEENSVKTCRDLLMWVCQLTGTFARMNRQGHLEVVPVTVRASAREIVKADRFTSDVSDFFIKVAKVTMKVGETEYSQGTDGMTMALDENPFLIGREDAGINAALGNILNQVTLAEYTPSNVDFPGDPSLQAGDYVTLTDAGILDSEVETRTYFLSPAFPASIEVRRNIATSMITHHTWRYRGKHNLKSAGKSDLIQGVQSQQSKAVSTIVAVARAAQEIAKAANQSTQLINDAIGGHVLIRQNPDETNEILIMDSADPDQAVKIWRWNMGGLGYSDNCTGADNPARQYEVAMTMDGAINANFIKTGKIAAQYITVGPESVFADGYDPTAIKIGGRNLIIRHNEVPDTMVGENGVSAPLVGSSMTNDFIPVQPGDALTFSQIIQSGTGDDYFRCAFYTDPLDNASYVVRRISNNATVFTETVPEGAFWLRVSYAAKNKVQVERGNKPTDWTPALEDVNASIARAQSAAENAQSAADTASGILADIANDDKLTPDEKQSTKKEWDIIVAEKPTIESQATTYGITTPKTNYTSAYNTLNTYITPLLSSLTTTSNIVGTTFRTNFKNYYDKRALLLKAISDKAKTNLADHDSNPSPHNLPSYARMENTGFTVYDDQGNKRTHSGQYSPGEYGFWVDAGHYMLRDMGIDMSLVQLPNLIPDHSFEYLGYTSDRDQNYHDNAVKITSSINQWYDWEKIGTPRLLRSDWTQRAPVYAGAQCVAMNSSNYLRMRIHCTANAKYFLSAYVARGFRNPTSGTPKIYIEYMTAAQQLITTGTHVFGINTGLFDWRRIGTQLTMPANCDHVRITFYSTNSNYVYWDGLQLVKGDKPVRYEPEESMWRHIRANVGIPAMGHVVEEDANANGFYTRLACRGQIPGLQICWYYGYKSVAINNAYGGLYQGTCPVSFPAEFTYQPAVAMGQARWGASASWGTPIDTTGQSVTLRFIDVAPRASSSIPISYIAIGRWEPDD
jgi:hypothetical protein